MPMTSPLAMTAATPIASKILVHTPGYTQKTGNFTKQLYSANILSIHLQLVHV